uniref:Uncharacterized protein n=1 Tax=Dunaliella tertiolecta TaxID=3047 RepID=A0A7S3R3A7_DUNTE
MGGCDAPDTAQLCTLGQSLACQSHDAPDPLPLHDTHARSMKRTEPSPEVNFTFVVLIVVVGLTIVLAIPYFLLQRRVGGAGAGKKGAGGGSFITSFAEVLQRNRKLQGGHVN